MKYLFLLLLSLSTFASEPKFHFGDVVVVTNGFYRGCCGEIRNFYEPNKYTVELTCKNIMFDKDFRESELKFYSKACDQ